MLSEETLFLGACAIKAARPHYSDDHCLAMALDLWRRVNRGLPFDQESIEPLEGPDPWADVVPQPIDVEAG